MDENKDLIPNENNEEIKDMETPLSQEEVHIVNDNDAVPEDESDIGFDGPTEDEVPDVNINIFDDTSDPDTVHKIGESVSEELDADKEEVLETSIEKPSEIPVENAETPEKPVETENDAVKEVSVEGGEMENSKLEELAQEAEDSENMVLETEKEEEKTENTEPPVPPITDPKKKSKAPYIAIGIAAVAVVAAIALFASGIIKLPAKTPTETVEPTPTEVVTPEPTPTPTSVPTPTPEPIPTPVPEVKEVDGEGELISIADESLIIKTGDSSTEYFFSEDLDVSQLVSGSKVQFVYIEDGSDLILKEISINMDQKPIETDPVEVVTTPAPTLDDVFKDFKDELQIIQGREPNDGDNNNESQLPAGEKVETMELSMDVGGSGALWFRFAWAKNDKTTVVPGVNDVIIELQTPSGGIISQENIAKHGRFWIEKNIINFAIKNGKAGTWKFLVTKSENQNLGDISANVLPLSGFITIDKADVNYVGDDLYAIWKITGVKDEEFSIKINAKNANGSDILVYSSSTVDEDIHLVDTVKLSTSKLPAGEYDFILTVEDWDCKTSNGKKQLTGKGMTTTTTISGIEIR